MALSRVAVIGAGFMGSGSEEAEGLVGRIAYTTDIADLDGVDAVMEAVTERAGDEARRGGRRAEHRRGDGRVRRAPRHGDRQTADPYNSDNPRAEEEALTSGNILAVAPVLGQDLGEERRRASA
jgi:hypothetical protein